MLDKLCAAGRIAWWRPVETSRARSRRRRSGTSDADAAGEREALAHWQKRGGSSDADEGLSSRAQKILESLRTHGASFFADLLHDAGLLGARSSKAWASWWRRAWSPAIRSPACARVMPAEKRRERLRRSRRPVID